MSKIRVLIGPKGQVKIEPIGFSGPACLAATIKLENALGKVKSREETDAMYEAEVDLDADAYA